LLLKQVWRKVDGEALPHLPISYCLQLLCLCLSHVCHGVLVLETHAHTTTLLLSKHCLLLLLSGHIGLLSVPLLLHHCRVHCNNCQPLFMLSWTLLLTHLLLLEHVLPRLQVLHGMRVGSHAGLHAHHRSSLADRAVGTGNMLHARWHSSPGPPIPGCPWCMP
jgi:hypothetical protein